MCKGEWKSTAELTRDIMRDLKTSAGEQTAVSVFGKYKIESNINRQLLVATVPAAQLATVCRKRLSWN